MLLRGRRPRRRRTWPGAGSCAEGRTGDMPASTSAACRPDAIRARLCRTPMAHRDQSRCESRRATSDRAMRSTLRRQRTMPVAWAVQAGVPRVVVTAAARAHRKAKVLGKRRGGNVPDRPHARSRAKLRTLTVPPSHEQSMGRTERRFSQPAGKFLVENALREMMRDERAAQSDQHVKRRSAIAGSCVSTTRESASTRVARRSLSLRMASRCVSPSSLLLQCSRVEEPSLYQRGRAGSRAPCDLTFALDGARAPVCGFTRVACPRRCACSVAMRTRSRWTSARSASPVARISLRSEAADRHLERHQSGKSVFSINRPAAVASRYTHEARSRQGRRSHGFPSPEVCKTVTADNVLRKSGSRDADAVRASAMRCASTLAASRRSTACRRRLLQLVAEPVRHRLMTHAASSISLIRMRSKPPLQPRQHVALCRTRRIQIDRVHGASLADAIDPPDALFEPNRVPRAAPD